uniref:DUF4378 domain-containing protein n=2 Tax=Kalanchoe fedtschenkoi TaxID=63787 RepID=A0A7N0V167_KALFE
MAAKLLHSLTDDNPDLQKQIGCMTGIFQMFDRHHMIVSGRRISDQSHRRTLPRHSQFSSGSLEEDFINAYQRQPAEMSSNKNAAERQRFSTESSRASFSSSRSSSFSSVDYCRSAQPDPAYNDRITFPEAAFDDSHCSISPGLARQSADFRDIVKDSMIKETRGLSVKTSTREESMSRVGRDLKLSKTADGVRTSGSQNKRENLKESLKALSKLQGASWRNEEPQERQRLSDFGYRSKEASRDGMETSRFSFDSRETLSASKLRDLPRLSLDGRECVTRQGDCDSLSSSRLKASLMRSCSTNEKVQNLREASGTQQRRPPSVVAKLMGLTALPDATPASRQDTGLIKTQNAQDEFEASSLGKLISDSKPPSPKKEPDSPRWITSDMKPISSSRIPVEQAPWKNQDRGVGLLKQSSRRIRSPTRQSNPFPSVYSEIEKRFKDIEFNQSGKDLRALKQILESIHAKGLMEYGKQEQASNVATGKQESTVIKANQRPAQGAHLVEVIPKHDNSSSSRPLESPIVIMKPISRSPRSETSKSMYRDHAASSNEKSKSAQHSLRPQPQPKDNAASSPRNLGSVSPRMRLKKLESEKQNQAQSHSSDGGRHRGQASKLQTESGSPGGKSRPKYSGNDAQQNRTQICEILLDIKKLRSKANEASMLQASNASLDPKKDREVTRNMRSSKLNGSHSPSKRAPKQASSASNHSLNPRSLSVQLDEAAPEHPSPVSVLTTSPYMDDLATEEKLSMTPPEDVAEVSSAYKSSLSGDVAHFSEISRKKLLYVDSLVQKLKRLNSTHDESRTDYIALLSENTNPDHRYISEILLASGLLLREFGSNAKPFQLHPSGNLINPELFNVLEQTKSGAHQRVNQDIKCHRKLIFDAVNEILIKKLASNGSLADCNNTVKPQKLARKALSAQSLMKELCVEMERFQLKKKKKKGECKLEDEEEGDALRDVLREDVMHGSDGWSVFEGGMSEVVLDVERWLFKDLVNEIVISDAVAYRLRTKSASRGNRLLK